MVVNSNLKSMVAGLYGLGLMGCTNYSKYNYNGLIGEEEVEFKQDYDLIYSKNILSVERVDGKKIKYIDSRINNLKIETVIITDGENGGEKILKYYISNDHHKPILETAQKQFDSYLTKILEIKLDEGMEYIKE